MDAQFWTYFLVGITFTLYIGIAIWSRAKSTKEFYVAGGGIHPVLNGMATAADWMSAASFISMAGIISFLGYGGSQYLMGWTGGYVLLALCLAPYLRKFGKFTVPDFIGERYVVLTRSADTVNMTVNGVSMSPASLSGTLDIDAIGIRATDTNSFNGSMYDIQIYNITNAELTANVTNYYANL